MGRTSSRCDPKRFRPARGEFFCSRTCKIQCGERRSKNTPKQGEGISYIFNQLLSPPWVGLVWGRIPFPAPLHGVGFGHPNPPEPRDSPRGMGRFVDPPRRTSRFAQPLKSCDSFPLFVAPVGRLIVYHKAAWSKGFLMGLRQERRRRWRSMERVNLKKILVVVASNIFQPIFFSEN